MKERGESSQKEKSVSERGRVTRDSIWMNMIKIYYFHKLKCHSEAHHYIQLIQANKKYSAGHVA